MVEHSITALLVLSKKSIKSYWTFKECGLHRKKSTPFASKAATPIYKQPATTVVSSKATTGGESNDWKAGDKSET